MSTNWIPDLSTVESPPRRDDIEYYDLEVGEEPLGKGGQTVVYEACVPDTQPPEKVAIRQLGEREFTKSIDREEFASFFDQAETWASLARRERTEPRWNDSEHIVGVVALGENLPWAALEYMDGGSLAERLDDGDGLPIEEAVWIGERLCQGLEVAHNTGVAHLDLKPENILFRKTGRRTWNVPKIADWGLARELLDETSDSMEVLSIKYAAPEQFDRDEFGRPGTATDIYQLGAVVYALLTGEPPYTGTDRSVIFDIVTEELPPPPSQRRSEISTELDAVVRTALEPRKSDRYGSIETFKRALRAIRLDGRFPSIVTERIEPEPTRPTLDSHETRDWAMFQGGPARTGYQPHTTGPQDNATVQWAFETDGMVCSSPAVVDGTVYIGSDDNHVYALDASTGTEHWRFQTDAYVRSSPVVEDNTVYIGCGFTNMDGGPEQWIGTHIYALDAREGTEQWRFQTDGCVPSSPVVVEGTIYAGSLDNNVYALDAKTSNVQWRFETGDNVRSSPAVVDGTVYVGSKDGHVYALDASDGTKHWRFQANHVEGFSSPAVDNDTVYIGSIGATDRPGPVGEMGKSHVHALSVDDGNQQWCFQTDYWVGGATAVADGIVYAGSHDNHVYALNAGDGTEQWRFETGNNVQSSPTVADGTVYVGSSDNHVYALDTSDGTERWRFQTDDIVHSSPAVADETVYVGSHDGYVYALSED